MWLDFVNPWAVLCVVVFIFLIVGTYNLQSEVPRHGGEAWFFGYELTDNPFVFDAAKATVWADQWINANRNSKGAKP